MRIDPRVFFALIFIAAAALASSFAYDTGAYDNAETWTLSDIRGELERRIEATYDKEGHGLLDAQRAEAERAEIQALLDELAAHAAADPYSD